MIKIIINGCGGTMGRVLSDTVLLSEQFTVAAGVDPAAKGEFPFPLYRSLTEVAEKGDVIVDFSVSEGIQNLLDGAVEMNLPAVIATTGLGDEHMAMIQEASNHIAVFQAANMSLGINLLKSLIKQAASVLGNGFDIEVVEKHHRLKRDAPSGTAMDLARTLSKVITHPVDFVYGRKNTNKLRGNEEIGIHAVRGGNIVGEHDVIFAGKDEVVTLQHTAFSKGLFAAGALKASEYIVKKLPGFYQMEHMIAESSTVTNLYTSDEALISFKRIPASLGTSHQIFNVFSQAGINIDMISQTITDEGFHSLSFSIDNKDSDAADKVLQKLHQDNSKLSGSLFTGLCKLTVEGIGMETQSGVAAAVFGIIDEMGVESKAVTTSETKISLIIDAVHKETVVQELNQRYNL